MYNRLRELRKNDLGISSTIVLAELLGGDDAGWWHQKIQKIETGNRALTDKDAHEISKKLNVPIWALFEESEDMEILAAFNKAPDHIKKTIKTLLKMER